RRLRRAAGATAGPAARPASTACSRRPLEELAKGAPGILVDVAAVREAEQLEVEFEHLLDAVPGRPGWEVGRVPAELEPARRIASGDEIAGEEDRRLAGPVEGVMVVLRTGRVDRLEVGGQ